MPGAGDFVSGGAVEGLTGTEKLVGLAAVFEELRDNLTSMLSSPATSGYGIYRLGKFIEDYYIKKIADANNLTKEQLRLLDSYSGKERFFLGLSAAAGAFVIRIGAVNAEMRKMSAEFGRFGALGNMPGGMSGGYNTALNIRRESLSNVMGTNPQFRKDFEQSYLELNRLMQQPGMKINPAQQKSLAETMARYNQYFGINAPEFMLNMAKNFSGQGMTTQMNKALIDILMLGEQKSTFGFANPSEAMGAFSNIFQGFAGQGVRAPLAAGQTLNLMEALGRRGLGAGGTTLGINEIENLAKIPTAILSNPNAAISFQRFSGLSQSQLLNQQTGGVNILASMQDFVKKTSGGKPIESPTALFSKNKEAWALLQFMGQQTGMSGLQFANMLNDMGKLNTNVKELGNMWDEAQQNKNKFFKDLGGQIPTMNNQIQEQVGKSQGLFQLLEGWGKKTQSFILPQNELPQSLIDLITLGTGAGIGMFGGKVVGKWAIKKVMKNALSYLPGGVKNASDITKVISEEGPINEQLALRLGKVVRPTTTAITEALPTAGQIAAETLPSAEAGIGFLGRMGGIGGLLSKVLGPVGMVLSFIQLVNDIKDIHEMSSQYNAPKLKLLPSIRPTGAPGVFHGFLTEKEPERVKNELNAMKNLQDENNKKAVVPEKTGMPTPTKFGPKKVLGEGLAGSFGANSSVLVIFSNDQGQVMGQVVTQPGIQQVIRLGMTGVLTTPS